MPNNTAQADVITAAPHNIDLDEKQEVSHVEEGDVADDTIMRSPFEDLSFLKTWVVYRKVAFVCLFAAFSAAADGFQIAMTSNIIANKGFIKQYGTAHDKKGDLILDANVLAIWGGIGSLGQGLGMLSQHFIADKFGRKYTMYVLWLALVAAVCLESFGRHWQTWLGARLTSGYGVGSVQFITCMYISELAPARIRGFLMIFYSFWYGTGQLCSSVALKVMNTKYPLDYLTPIYCEWAMLGIMLGIYVYLPETPYWCANHGQHERGRAIIKRVNGGIEGYDVDFHYELIRRAVEKEKAYQKSIDGGSTGFLQELRNVKEVLVGVNGFRTLVAFWPAFVQQLGGLAVLGGYSTYFAQMAGFSDPFMFSVLLSLIALGTTVVEASLIDLIGRRNLFLFAVVSTWAFCLIVGGLGLAPNRSYALNQLVLFFSLMWRLGGTLIGNLGWAFVAETGSSRLKAKTAGVAALGGVCLGLVFNTTTPYMLNANYANWGLKTAFFYSGISTPFVIASFFLIPDTSRRTPAELDEMFRKKIKPWRFRGYVTDAQKALQAERDRTGETNPARLQRIS